MESNKEQIKQEEQFSPESFVTNMLIVTFITIIVCSFIFKPAIVQFLKSIM